MSVESNIAQILINVSLKDWLTIAAILTAPVSALWIQSKLDERKETRKRRLDIFKTLMATRAAVMSQDHIKALNMIDIEFYRGKKYKKVKEAWCEYSQARTQDTATTDAEQIEFNMDCEDTLTELLIVMGKALGYDFDPTHIMQSIYKPQGHVTDEEYQMFIKTQLMKLFTGDFSLPVSVDEVQEHKRLRKLAIKYLEGKLTK